MQVKLWEPCCSLAIIEEDGPYAYDWTLEVDEETAERWQIVMQHYDRVQEEMRATIAGRRPDQHLTVTESPCAGHMHLHAPDAPTPGTLPRAASPSDM
jgi:hypothetical protein